MEKILHQSLGNLKQKSLKYIKRTEYFHGISIFNLHALGKAECQSMASL